MIKIKSSKLVKYRKLELHEIILKGDFYYWSPGDFVASNDDIITHGTVGNYYWGISHEYFISKNPSYKIARIAKKRIG